jgi:hypothetical protein
MYLHAAISHSFSKFCISFAFLQIFSSPLLFSPSSQALQPLKLGGLEGGSLIISKGHIGTPYLLDAGTELLDSGVEKLLLSRVNRADRQDLLDTVGL